MVVDLVAWRRLIEADPPWLTVERELLMAAERLAKIEPAARDVCYYTGQAERSAIAALCDALESL